MKRGENLDSISSVTASEESDELLVISEKLAGCDVSEIILDRSIECGGFEGEATMFEVLQQAQQCSIEWLSSLDSIIESTSAASGRLWF